MLEIKFQAMDAPLRKLKYVVLVTKYKGRLVVVRHKDRTTWEVPGGHIELGEKPDEAAARELVEETGAVTFSVKAITDYSVSRNDEGPTYGRLYYCTIDEIGPLGDTEIGEVKMVDNLPENLTYKDIQPKLMEKVMNSL